LVRRGIPFVPGCVLSGKFLSPKPCKMGVVVVR
jgi:hypothetical protein